MSITYVQNDTRPNLSGAITADDGSPENIAGYTITLHIGTAPATVLTAIIAQPETGVFYFDWPGNLPVGSWPIELQTTDSQGGIITANKDAFDRPLQLIIEKEIA